MRDNRFCSSKARCPFYKWQENKSVTCDGPGLSSKVELTFRNETQRTDYIEKYCNKDYEQCLICQGLMEEAEEAAGGPKQ